VPSPVDRIDQPGLRARIALRSPAVLNGRRPFLLHCASMSSASPSAADVRNQDPLAAGRFDLSGRRAAAVCSPGTRWSCRGWTGWAGGRHPGMPRRGQCLRTAGRSVDSRTQRCRAGDDRATAAAHRAGRSPRTALRAWTTEIRPPGRSGWPRSRGNGRAGPPAPVPGPAVRRSLVWMLYVPPLGVEPTLGPSQGDRDARSAWALTCDGTSLQDRDWANFSTYSAQTTYGCSLPVGLGCHTGDWYEGGTDDD
jgi:hypothetical protein